ncbi:MAG: rhombosortase [Gammaproteobacteria bacterium]|nr:rhombosortase [Gammaproteobacteria bacterium]
MLEFGGEAVRSALRFDRDGLASGEIWRLLSGHVVHLGPSHAAMNVVALLVLAVVFAARLKPLDWLLGGAVAAVAIDLGLYLLSPEIVWYVGLSGVLHGYWASGAVLSWRLHRLEAVVLAALLLLKLFWENVAGPVPLTRSLAAGPVVTDAHLYGTIGGLVWGIVAAVRRER